MLNKTSPGGNSNCGPIGNSRPLLPLSIPRIVAWRLRLSHCRPGKGRVFVQLLRSVNALA